MASNKYSARNFDLKRLNDNRENELSKILELNSLSFSTQLIAIMQSRINNTLFKLSPNDYKVICGNKMMINMMSKVIKCDAKQLKKFCKYINVFIENIESSPKSIKKKIIASRNLMRGSLSVLPYDILDKIVKKYISLFPSKYVLKDWIPLNKLNGEILSENPAAIDYLKENRNLIDWKALLRNPNPAAIDFLIENKNNIPTYYELLINNISPVSHNKAITNPAAIEYIKDVLNRYPDNIEWHLLSLNPNAIELLKQKIREEFLHPNVDEFVEDDPLSGLHNIIQPHYSKKIDWWALSSNPNAIELLIANREKIHWDGLSANTNLKAIELLKEKINAENLINQRVLNNLNYSEKIAWWALSQNPNAIELLKRNIDKINWALLSKNPNQEAIKLLKANPFKIDWNGLSINPNALELLKEYPKKINWDMLSKNPNPEALELLIANRDKIHWDFLNANPSIFEAVLE